MEGRVCSKRRYLLMTYLGWIWRFITSLVQCCNTWTGKWKHGWEIAVILWNFRKTKLSKSKIFFPFFFLQLYFNIHTMCNSTTFALRHTQISLSSILRHFRPPSRHLLLNTHDTNMEFLQLNGPLLDIFLFFTPTYVKGSDDWKYCLIRLPLFYCGGSVHGTLLRVSWNLNVSWKLFLNQTKWNLNQKVEQPCIEIHIDIV